MKENKEPKTQTKNKKVIYVFWGICLIPFLIVFSTGRFNAAGFHVG